MLLDLPEIRKELEQDPSRWPAAVEELMRLVSPNQFIRRRVREDVVLGEQTMRAGDTVLLFIAAANRDPEAFPDPTGSCSTVRRPSRSVTGSITASVHLWRGSKAASHCKPCLSGGRPAAKLGSWNTPITSSADTALSPCCRVLSARKIASRRASRAANLRVMTMICMVRRVRAAALGLAPAGSVLG